MGMPDNTDAFTIVDGLGNDGTERLRITSAGDVGIGTDDPLHKIHADGQIFAGSNYTGTQYGGVRIAPKQWRWTSRRCHLWWTIC